jgi:uncharacterized protein (UPF0333 family)
MEYKLSQLAALIILIVIFFLVKGRGKDDDWSGGFPA